MKETFYFSHDYNARSDEKILNLRADLGAEGYGTYWMIIEILYQADGYLKLSSIKSIAYEIQSQYDRIESVIKNYDLFVIKDDVFYSESVLRRLQERDEKSQKARESVMKRWKTTGVENTNVIRTQYDTNTIKERKGKERKIKESILLKKEEKEKKPLRPETKAKLDAMFKPKGSRKDGFSSLTEITNG